ncbi:MAG: isoprenyl transferase [Syntrophaceae bacterium]
MTGIDKDRIPAHIAIIMDGNGRWAKQHALGRVAGHKKGVDAVRDTVTACREIGVRYLTLYAFSSENWNRPNREVSALMRLLERFLQLEFKTLQKNNIRLAAIGDLKSLPERVLKTLNEVIGLTSGNSAMTLILALSYGGRDEILDAVKRIAGDSAAGKLDAASITKKNISDYLYTEGIPDPDLLIRTSGEYRISNFLLWQTAYTEFYFTDVLWPDFRKKDLLQAIADYQKRERRFGLTSDQLVGDLP